MKNILTLTVGVLLYLHAAAQTPPICPGGSAPSDFCATACISCDFQNGTMYNTGNYTADFPDFDCLNMHNNLWLAFIANESSATFTATPSNCVMGTGVQMALYDNCHGPCLALAFGCPFCGNVPATFTFSNMQIGQVYYLVIDGYGPEVCDVTLTVEPISAVQSPALDNVGPLGGAQLVCPQKTFTYCLDEVPGASKYIWNIPADATLNGQPGPGPITLTGPNGHCVDIKFGASTGLKQICVRPVNTCYQGEQKCLPINVRNIPDKVFPPALVCQGDVPGFSLPWGDAISAQPGTKTYQVKLVDPAGCDSVVKQTVTVVPPVTTNLPTQVICAGTCTVVAGESFCAAGSYAVTLSTPLGCDSIVKFSVATVSANAAITPSGTLNCQDTSVTLRSMPQAGAIKIWRNAQGQAIGSADSLAVSQPGLYSLTVTAAAGAISCSDTDTILISGNLHLPVQASASGALNCASVEVQLSALANWPNTVFGWTGPGNFSSSIANPVVTVPGDYSVTVSTPSGCSGTAVVPVFTDTLRPEVSTENAIFTCTVHADTLEAFANVVHPLFTWNGPANFTDSTANPVVSIAGLYSVTVTNAGNGCTASATAAAIADFVPPTLTAAVSGTIGCPTPVVTLSAISSSGSSFLWSGPAGFNSILQGPGVQTAGIYTVTVTDTEGCTNSATLEVSGNTVAPGAAATGGVLSCAAPLVALAGSSTTAGAEFSWAGPGNFTSQLPNPGVTEPGAYILTVTGPNGCTAVDTASVDTDFAVPDVAASGGTINCVTAFTAINGSSNSPGAVFSWAGPSNFSSNLATTTVVSGGTYVLSVSALNGCTATATAIVVADTTPPSISAAAGTITCANTTALLDGHSPTAGVQYAWKGPNNFNAAVADTSATTPGTYELLVTDPANGCSASMAVIVVADDTIPDIQAFGGILTCSATTVPVQGQSSVANASWAWSGPDNFSSAEQNPLVQAAGAYLLTVTDPANGCTASASAVVDTDLAHPQASAFADTLSCAQPAVTLHSSADLPASFSWTGPNGFVSSDLAPLVGQPGIYALLATAANGCTDTAVVLVHADTTPPDVTAFDDTLNCLSATAALQGFSSTPGISWSWSGPGNFTSGLPNPNVAVPGAYTLTVTAPNGCSASASATVHLDTDAPWLNVSGATPLTCIVDSVWLEAHILPGVSGQWNTGEADNLLLVVAPGTYSFTAIGPNGCLSTQNILIPRDTASLQGVVATGGQIDCNFPAITLTGHSSAPAVSWVWSGPGNFNSTVQNPGNINEPGTYTLTVTAAANGCSASAAALVTRDLTPPALSAAAGTLTCVEQELVLDANSDSPNAAFSWTGPGNFISMLEDPLATQAGVYTVVAKAANGCTASYTLTVLEDKQAPGASAKGDTLTCSILSGFLNGDSPAAGAGYSWAGPGNFESFLQNPPVDVPGVYQLTVTGSNGCTSTAQTIVVQNVVLPAVSASGGTVTCIATLAPLAALTDPGSVLNWSGPGGFVSTVSNPGASMPGLYTVTATGPNGCTASATATVTADQAPPALQIEAPQELDCNTFQVELIAQAPGPAAFLFDWKTSSGHILSGENGPVAVVSRAGTYTLLLTNTQNGCTTEKTVEVTENQNIPAAIAAAVRDISCFGRNDGAIRVDGVSGGAPPLLFSLDGQPFSARLSYSQLSPGPHTLALQDAAGCELDTVLFIQEPGPLLVSLGPDTTLRLGNPITLAVFSAVNDPLRVSQWSTQPFALSSDTVIYPVKSFLYTLSVSDSNHCFASGRRFIQVDKRRQVYIPNAFHPEGSVNAVVTVYGGPDVRLVRSFLVFDRWGSSVHEAHDFLPGDEAAGWTGLFRGTPVNPGVFAYLAEIEFIDGAVEVFSGDVTVAR